MAKNILVNGKNNITAQRRANAMADIQTSMANSTSATNVNTTPNLPTSITRPERTINLQKAQQPVNTKLENLNQATGKITGNNPAFYNGQLISQNNQPSRFIGFQQPTTLNSTQPQAKSFNKLMNGGYGYIASDVNKAESANRKEEQRYRNMSEAFYDLQGTLYNRGKTLSENEIRQKFPEFKDLDMNVLNDLQNELLPIVSSGMGVDADQISQIYPELLKGKELKDVEDIKKKSELSNKNFQQLDKTISKALKTDWELYSTNGLKYIQNAKKITDAVKIAKQQGIVGGANDFEIARELAKSNPELQQAIKEMNRLELTESDKVRLGKSGNLLVAAREGLQTGIWNDIFGESETPISDEELDSAIRARDKLENDFWRQTGKKIATEIGVPLDSLEKFTYKTYKDIQNKILDTGMEYTKDYAKKQIKSAFKEGLGVELTDEQLNSIDNVYNTAVAPSINEQIKTNQQNVMDYIESVNKEYENRKRRNLDTDVENYVNNRSMTQSLLAGDLSSFGYKAAGETAQNAEMPLIIAAGAVAPEVVLPLMAVDSYSRENQEAFEELTKAGANYEQAQEGAAIVGLASSAVEVGLEKLLGGVETTASKALHDALIKDFTKKATEMVAERGLVDILKQGATTQFRSSLEEGLEEVLQQVIHNRAVQQYDPNQEITEGLLESFEGGFFNPMNLLAGGGEVYGGIKNNSETIKQNAYETAYNLGQKTRQVTDKVDNALNKGAYNAGRGARIVTDAVENAKNKVTSQGGKYNTQGQQQVQEVNTTSENGNNINGENYTENGGWSQPKKGVIGKALSGIGKAYDSTVGKAIDTVAEKGAEAITSTSTPQDKLFQAVSPTLNKLTNKRGNYEQKRQNADRTNELIVEYGHTPTNSTEYYDALIKTKNALWKNEIQRGLDEHKYTTISSKELTDAVRDEMQEDARFPLETNKSDLAKLNKELASLDRQGELTLEQLEAIKQQINAKLNYGKNAEAGEIYEKGLRAMNTKISQIEDQLIAKLPGEFTKFKKDYGALKDMEEDVLKMMLKDMKKKDGGGLTQNMGRLAGVGKLLSSPLEGTMQIIFGETIGKAKETNFLIQKGFEDLRNQYKGEKKTLDVKDKPAEKVLALPDGIKLTKVTEIDNRKPKNKVTKKNNKSDNNKKSDSSSSDDGGTPTGGTPTGTNPTNNQGGTTDDTKTKKQPKKKAETKTKATSKKSAVTDYINETPQNERGQLEEIEAEENLRNNETPQDIKAMEEQLDYLDNLLENETPQITEEEAPKNKVTAKTPEKPKNLVTNSEFQTLPEDVSVWREQKKNGPKRIAPDRISWQQLTYEDGAKRIMEDIKKIARHIELQREFKKPSASRTDMRPLSEINSELLQTGREVGSILGKNWLYKSTRSQEFKDLWKAIANANNDPSTLASIGKDFYEKKVKQDLSKGYVYPDDVIDKIPGAKKAADARQRYQKGLDTSFSSKDERIDYSAKDKIGGGMKRQDGKLLTEEQKNEIVKGVVDFQKTFAINMKKMAEDLGIVYVHVNGKKVFMSKASGMFKREYNDDGTLKNASISVGGVETVRWKDAETGEWKTESANTIMSHELGHVVDYVVDRNLIVGRDITDLWTSYKRPENNHSGYAAYLRRDAEVVARAFEEYLDVAKGGDHYFDKVGYWSKDKFEKLVKPILERNIKEKLGDWYINPDDVKYQKVLSNSKNKVTNGVKKADSKLKNQIKKDMDQLMKTGLVKGYQFVQSTKDLFNLINGTTTQPRYQAGYHGSPNSFEKFDSSHMGEGEGHQAHGWGHYIAIDKDTAKNYAENFARYKGGTIHIDSLSNDEDLVAYKVLSNLQMGMSLDESMEDVKSYYKDEKKFYENAYKEDKIDRFKELAERCDRLIKAVDELNKSDFNAKRNLYEVEIPNQRKANTPTRSNYLEEGKVITGPQYEKIHEKLAEYNPNIKDDYQQNLPYYNWRKTTGYGNAKELYEQISGILGSDKEASKFLESLGYDGIHYFGGRDGEAYVIFGDDTAEITNHIQYLKDNQGNIAGATLPDGTVIFVEDALRADTAFHETSHRLVSYAKENSPELYNSIVKIAEEAPQELKDYVKNTYGDLSPEAFIDEVFAWRQGKYSSVKSQAWYNRMWNAIKELWNKIRGKFGKEYADLSVFEGWEKMNSEQLMKEVDNLLKGGKEVGEGKGSLRYEQAGTNSPEFKKWFNGSKVVDENGEPLVVYHSTNTKRPFYQFKTDKPAWFTPNETYSNSFYAPKYKEGTLGKQREYEVYLDIKNPAYVGNVDGIVNDYKIERLSKFTGISIDELNEIREYYGALNMFHITNTKEFKKLLEKKGYDGIEAEEGGTKSYGVFKPTQIKSATDNIGTYDKNNPDIRYQRTQNRVIKGTDKDMRDNLSKMMRTMRNNAIAGGLSVPKYNNGGQLENALRTIWRINSDKDMIQDNNTYGDVLDDKVDGMMQIANIIDHGNNNENIHYKRFYDPLGNENYKQTLIFWKGNTIEDALSQANPPVRDVHLGITNQTKKSINKSRKPNGKLDRTPMRSRIGHKNKKPISNRIVINQKKQS